MAMYINMPPIKGESTDSEHEDWIRMLNFDHGVSNSVSMGSGRGGLGVGSTTHGNFQITKEMDKSTPELNLFCSQGKEIKEVIVHLCLGGEEGQFTYMEYKFEKVKISSVSIGGSEGANEKPTESVSFAYSKITWKFTTQDNDGKKTGDSEKSWDLAANKGE